MYLKCPEISGMLHLTFKLKKKKRQEFAFGENKFYVVRHWYALSLQPGGSVIIAADHSTRISAAINSKVTNTRKHRQTSNGRHSDLYQKYSTRTRCHGKTVYHTRASRTNKQFQEAPMNVSFRTSSLT